MDSTELLRLRLLASRETLSADELEEFRDLARLAVCEIKGMRTILADMQAAMKRAAMETV